MVRAVNDKEFDKLVLIETYRVMSEKLKEKTTTMERAALKNLGTWLGLLTLGKEKPIVRK